MKHISVHIASKKECLHRLEKLVESVNSSEVHFNEIIIIDNNHSNAEYCKNANKLFSKYPNVKYYHYPIVSKYKAGALNIALSKTSNVCDYIFVIDADYVLENNVFEKLNYYINFYPNRALYQFPQSYELQSLCVNLHYKKYFDTILDKDCIKNKTLCTGTLALIHKESLKSVGGWKGLTLTEDAELGLHLINSGFKTIFINDVIGKGYLPLNNHDAIKQKKRWALGNIHSLVYAIKKGLKINFPVIRQLTYWTDAIIPLGILSLIICSLLAVFEYKYISLIILFLYTIYFLKVFFLQLFYTKSLHISYKLFRVNLLFIDVSTFLYILQIFAPDKRFVVTPKKNTDGRKVKLPIITLIVICLAIGLSIGFQQYATLLMLFAILVLLILNNRINYFANVE